MSIDNMILAALQRLESKVDALIAALAEDEDDKPNISLDGEPFPGERDQSQSLG
jgi:hypothetical protein